MISGHHTLFKPRNLDDLPAELIALIASHCNNDHDVISLYLTKKQFLDRINKFAYLFKMKCLSKIEDDTIYFGDVNQLLLRAYFHPEKLVDHISYEKVERHHPESLLFYLLMIVSYVILFPALIDNFSLQNLSKFIISFGAMKMTIDTYDNTITNKNIINAYTKEGIIAILDDESLSHLLTPDKDVLENRSSEQACEKMLTPY